MAEMVGPKVVADKILLLAFLDGECAEGASPDVRVLPVLSVRAKETTRWSNVPGNNSYSRTRSSWLSREA
jgi:hypothetical protein